MPPVHSLAWRFGGPLAPLPPALAWAVLAVVGLLGAAWIIRSYRRTLVSLAPGPRRLLIALRLLLWTGILFALAGPARVERLYAQKETRPLAVLIDQSASMTTPDNRHQRRLDDALRHWRALAPAAESAHGRPQMFAFADSPAPTALSAADADGGLPAGQTRLFASLDHLLAKAPPGGWGGIVTLTDGLDTLAGRDYSGPLAATTRAALAAGTPIYPVSGKNRYAGGDLFAFRELVLPASVPPRSSFRFEVTLDTYQAAARTVPLRLKVGDAWRAPEPVHLAAGRRALAWSVELPAEAPGLLPLELRAGDAADGPSLRAEVRIAAPTNTRVLYYQGALDWGYRFLADILRRDPAFTLTPIFNLAPGSSKLAPPAIRGSLTDLPTSVGGYAKHDILILANATAAQLSAAQQNALSAWVRAGGVLLFIAPDDDATRGFSGSELEKLLPVVFLGDSSNASSGSASIGTQAFRDRIRRLSSGEDGSSRASREPPLAALAWEPRARALFGDELAAAAPRFGHFAHVSRAKPGAEILGRHPTDLAPDGQRSILLALQRYGRGWSAVLASDALWRWKLNQPSRERGVELFWQNLLSWLGRERTRGPRFVNAPLEADPGAELDIVLVDAPPDATVSAQLEDDAQTGAFPLLTGGMDNGAHVFRWTPPVAGRWALTARSGGEIAVRHWVNVTQRPSGEASGLPGDESLLRALAERTGGTLLADTPPPAWQTASGPDTTLLRETVAPLWHRAWIFAILLALYVTELLLRRRQKLL